MRTKRLRPALMVVAAAVLGLGGPAAAASSTAPPAAPSAAPRAQAVPGPVVLLGTTGLRWDDVGAGTRGLTSMARQDSVGWLVVRSVRSTTCPIDGWLAISAGRRAADARPADPPDRAGEACRPLPAPDVAVPGGGATVPAWAGWRAEVADQTYDARLGVLGDTLAQAGVSTAAVGPGAAIALAGGDGTLAHAWAGGADANRLAGDVAAALRTGPRLLVVDLGGVGAGVGAGPGRAQQVGDVDARANLVRARLPADATVIVASLADDGTSRLRLLTARGPAVRSVDGRFGASLLGADSTRQDGLVQATDLAPSLLTALGLTPPAAMVGAPMVPVERGGDAADRLEHLADLDAAALAVRPVVPWFFNGLVIGQVVLYGLATLILRRRRRRIGGDAEDPAAALGRRAVLAWLRWIAVVSACVPAATFLANLVPWWRSGTPGLAVILTVIGFVVPIALLALLGPWRRSLLGCAGVVGAVTALVLGIDVITGSHLALSSLMGPLPMVAGRFYGFGNPAFALFSTGALLAATAYADRLASTGRRRAGACAVVLIGVVVVLVDGTPGLGSDFGGPPAIVPAFAVLALLVAGIAITGRRVLLIGGGTVSVIVVLSLIDWLRPAEERTHLGRFVQTVIDGGAGGVIVRKLQGNLSILIGSPLSALIPVAVLFVVLVLSRPVSWGARPLALAYDRSPVLKHGLVAFGVLVLIGFAMNDSGAVVPAVAATLALPLLIAISVRALQLADSQTVGAAVAPAPRPSPPPGAARRD